MACVSKLNGSQMLEWLMQPTVHRHSEGLSLVPSNNPFVLALLSVLSYRLTEDLLCHTGSATTTQKRQSESTPSPLPSPLVFIPPAPYLIPTTFHWLMYYNVDGEQTDIPILQTFSDFFFQALNTWHNPIFNTKLLHSNPRIHPVSTNIQLLLTRWSSVRFDKKKISGFLWTEGDTACIFFKRVWTAELLKYLHVILLSQSKRDLPSACKCKSGHTATAGSMGALVQLSTATAGKVLRGPKFMSSSGRASEQSPVYYISDEVTCSFQVSNFLGFLNELAVKASKELQI